MGTGSVGGWRLVFHKRGQDGSAKCDAAPEGPAGARLWLAAYEMSAADKVSLDRIEGLGRGYAALNLALEIGSQQYRGFLYVAAKGHTDPELRPFDWYREMVHLGARFHGFPDEYCARIQGTSGVLDPIGKRAEEQWQVIAAMRAWTLPRRTP